MNGTVLLFHIDPFSLIRYAFNLNRDRDFTSFLFANGSKYRVWCIYSFIENHEPESNWLECVRVSLKNKKRYLTFTRPLSTDDNSNEQWRWRWRQRQRLSCAHTKHICTNTTALFHPIIRSIAHTKDHIFMSQAYIQCANPV